MKTEKHLIPKVLILLSLIAFVSAVFVSCKKTEPTETDAPDTVLTVTETDAGKDPSGEPFTVYENGKACRISVIGKNSTVQSFAEKLAFTLSQSSGLGITATYAPGSADEPEILIGINAYDNEEAARLYAASSTGSWYAYRIGNKLLIWSADISGYTEAYDSVCNYILYYKKDGYFSFDSLFYGRKQYFRTDFEIPAPDSLSASFVQHTGGTDATLTDVEVGYEKVALKDFEAYKGSLISLGFELMAENTISGNYYLTFIKGNEMLTVDYYSAASVLRVIAEPKPEKPFWEFPSGERTGSVSLMMIKDETKEHASSFVITLADGRYFIFDTGVYESHRQIFEYMEKNNRFTDGKVHIAAIMISHPHVDHMNGITGLANTYADRIECEAVMYNLISNEMQSVYSDSTLNERRDSINSAAKKLGADIYCVRAGQKFDFAGTTLEILFTPDELGSYKLTGVNSKGESDTNYDMNNSSLIVMLKEGGQEVVFTGDCRGGEAGIISSLFSKGFPGDIIAVAHHGFNVSGSLWMYNNARPSVLLWTIRYDDVDRTRAFVKNLEAASYVKKHFYEDEQVVIPLPYTP